MRRSFAFAALLLTTATPALAQNSAPQPVPYEDTIPAPKDVPYPGTIMLNVDATDVEQGIFHVRETIPVAQAGPMVLLYPSWLPGKHASRGEIEKLTGLTITANGETVPWVRDSVDVYAFHLDVPEGVDTLELSFQFTSAVAGNQGRIVVAPSMMNLQFPSVSLYPAGYFTRQIPIEATVTYPEGWTARSGLPATNRGSVYSYEPTNYMVLVDSPVFAGRYFREWELTDRVDLNVFADAPEQLAAATDEMIETHRALVEQAVKLFGTQQYDQYEFLLALTGEMGGIGLEHHRSSENGVDTDYFSGWENALGDRGLLPHEFVHSWNGKYRRGEDLWTPDFRTPMRDNQMWVYEGQTQFWGVVLAARSGMIPKEDVLGLLAFYAAIYGEGRAGRQWRPLIDTTHDPIIAARKPKPWTSWQRSEDYYVEGLLIWLETDAKIRELTGGEKSIDDFARAFFGSGRDGDWGEVTYDFAEVVDTLNGVVAWDWDSFLTERVYDVNPDVPLAGFTENGYRLVFTETPNSYMRNYESQRNRVHLGYSIGLVVSGSGNITEVTWGGPAFEAGLDVADDLIAVNGTAYSNAGLKAAVTAAKDSSDPIRLTVRSGDRIHEVVIDYHGGLRYPRLEKIASGEAGLDRLLQAK
ncbi:M61 family metallopeptidase [Stakelama tenebrarum]|uniref:M61 family metallopeptidase n=1 Tax=Stakelama tenebrarum TaxID=2711215 RepID=A0A6G6Y8W1_9SPHN|nr:PDZ domain-containing protein [Sphingosinithalassobacter tenebrarum]QIG81365.1 M61 family metallopeptidase [Sphingosinithalassobacter tenebrarum]